jgi:hypothetical protein
MQDSQVITERLKVLSANLALHALKDLDTNITIVNSRIVKSGFPAPVRLDVVDCLNQIGILAFDGTQIQRLAACHSFEDSASDLFSIHNVA